MTSALALSAAVALFAAASAEPALACKVPAELPPHMYFEKPATRATYVVVKILGATRDSISGRVVEGFGSTLQTGSAFTMWFIPNEEPHAVCRVPMLVGETWLVQVRGASDRLEISRYDWFNNVSSTHERFPQYIADLKQSR